MIKLENILQEGTLQLTSDERSQVENMLPDILKAVSGKYIGDNMAREIGVINAISADKTPIKVKVFVGNDLSQQNSQGYYRTNDRENPEDNEILLQQFHFAPYFKGLSGLDMKVTKLATGSQNPGIERLRTVLKHELIHAKDPAINQRHRNEPYNRSSEESYYKSWTEFQTMTGQFFEAITTGVDRALKLGMTKDEVLKALDNIVNYYAGKEKSFNQYAKDFIQGTGKRNAFQSIINFVINLPSEINDYAGFIKMIQKYNPEGYKEFLKDLYKTVDQAKKELKNLKEMQYTDETKRFQQLAGITVEAEESSTDPVANKDAEQGLKSALSILQSGVNSVKPSSEDGKIDEAAGLVLGLVASAPGLINLAGKAVNSIASIFQKDKKKGTVVGNALKHWGHELEDAYIAAIADILKKIYPKSFGNESVEDKTSALYDAAHSIYAAILAAAAITSGMGAMDAHSLIAKGLEGGLSAFKTSEIVTLAKKIAAV